MIEIANDRWMGKCCHLTFRNMEDYILSTYGTWNDKIFIEKWHSSLNIIYLNNIGLLGYLRLNSFKNEILISSIQVDKMHWRENIGRSLIDYSKKYTKNKNKRKITLHSPLKLNNLEFYKKCMFNPVSENNGIVFMECMLPS